MVRASGVIYPNTISLIALMLHSANHWFKFEKRVNLFENITFPFLKAKREEFGYPKEQYSLIVMDTFTCQKDDCQLVY